MRHLIAAVLIVSFQAVQEGPPKEAGPFRTPDLVELTTLDPGIRLDIRYATPNNLAGRPVYAEARAFLQRPAADALLRAHLALKPQGYGLLVFDGYRPTGSKHHRGCAVDLSMYDLKTGREVEMPSVYDEMSPRAYPDYTGGTADARQRRDILRAAMEHEGFIVEPNEWWHFNYKDWQAYPILDIPFAQIRNGGRR